MTTSVPSFSVPKAREAIVQAEKYLRELFPGLAPFAFEEIRHDSLPTPRWALTFSYRTGDFPFPRYKVVEIAVDGLGLLQVTNR